MNTIKFNTGEEYTYTNIKDNGDGTSTIEGLELVNRIVISPQPEKWESRFEEMRKAKGQFIVPSETVKSFIRTEIRKAEERGYKNGRESNPNRIGNQIIHLGIVEKEIYNKAITDAVVATETQIAIHKQLEKECVGSIEEITKGLKRNNPHTFVIEQLQHLLSNLEALKK